MYIPKNRYRISVWPWEYAPNYFRELSPHGGDEDWVAFVPAILEDYDIEWLRSGGPFGVCDVTEHKVADGTVYIGAHA